MFFSKFARVVAALVLVVGASQVLMGFSIASGWMGADVDFGRYTTAATTGELIDRGVYRILIALALGTLAEIGLAIQKSNRGQ